MSKIRAVWAALLLVVTLSAGVLVDASPAAADPAYDICAVLKASFDPNNTAYEIPIGGWAQFQEIIGTGHVHDHTMCLFVPQDPDEPSFGWLCMRREGHKTPAPGFTVNVDGPVSASYYDPVCPFIYQ